ncbi:BLOC-1-related complex subunit 7-like [Lingula anatina]|uniref:BLOC-1-related complex subunit 7 n=1 Tax=Lingula anatina TaxID=7574 RepID=A0A1S3HD06_LINAN|nr:BLOC-1-related complex subunit 7-like [Lingula anatina]|eukprot:XP_013382999.1 BLOC-1-related complex subunit 7-like [Lingula anatina]
MASSNWNQETKARLQEKITTTVCDAGSLARQVLKVSKSTEALTQAAKNFAFHEGAVENSYQTLQRMGLTTSHLQFQQEAIERRCVENLPEIMDQLKKIQR